MDDKRRVGLGRTLVVAACVFVVVCIGWDLLTGMPPISWMRGVAAALITLVLELIAAFLIWKVWRGK